MLRGGCVRAELRGWLVLAVLGCVALPRAAHAFCRTTTCDPNEEFCAMDAHGCVIDGLPVFWSEPCVTVWLPAEQEPLAGVDAATFAQLTQAAFARWSDVDCRSGGVPDIDIHIGGALECALTGYDPDAMQNVNTLRVVRENWPHPGVLGEVALTTVTAVVETGEILDADIEINDDQNDFATSGAPGFADLDSALTHEAGHVLGLAHSDQADATMFWSARGTSLRSLEADDVAGICAIYPSAPVPAACGAANNPANDPGRVCEAVVTPRTGMRAGCSVVTPGMPGAAATAAGLLLAALCAALRRRKQIA